MSTLALAVTVIEIAASESTVLDNILLLVICVVALVPLLLLAKAVLVAERPATDTMRARGLLLCWRS